MTSSSLDEAASPSPMTVYPLRGGAKGVTNVRPTVSNPAISVGDFTYFTGEDFERRVIHHYDFIGDRLVIGRFCQIGEGVTFVMNGANHQMNAVSTFPFYVMEGWRQEPPPLSQLPLKGDTVVGNDVWIGQDATILPGVHIGDGAIIGTKSVVSRDVEPYAIVVGNPARETRKRFDGELVQLMLRLKWWDRPVEEIQALVPLLTCGDLERVRRELKAMLG